MSYRPGVPRVLLAAVAVAGLVGCSGSGPAPQAAPTSGPSARATEVPDDTVQGRLGDVPLALEVADDPQERARGLMGRTEVPAGTGMVFRFDEPLVTRFYMYRVPVPLHAAFVLDGRVVHTVVMPPCAETDPTACPTYGPATPFDTVVETSPETAQGVRVGDAFTLSVD